MLSLRKNLSISLTRVWMARCQPSLGPWRDFWVSQKWLSILLLQYDGLSFLICCVDRIVLTNSSFSGTIPVELSNLSRMSEFHGIQCLFPHLHHHRTPHSYNGKFETEELYLDHNSFRGTLYADLGKMTSLGTLQALRLTDYSACIRSCHSLFHSLFLSDLTPHND